MKDKVVVSTNLSEKYYTHPRRLTWNLRLPPRKGKPSSKPSLSGARCAKLQGCSHHIGSPPHHRRLQCFAAPSFQISMMCCLSKFWDSQEKDLKDIRFFVESRGTPWVFGPTGTYSLETPENKQCFGSFSRK